jgi:hypothetical protein
MSFAYERIRTVANVQVYMTKLNGEVMLKIGYMPILHYTVPIILIPCWESKFGRGKLFFILSQELKKHFCFLQ